LGNRARYQVRSFRKVFLQGGSLNPEHRAGSLYHFLQAGMNSRREEVVVSEAPAPPVRHLWEDGGSQLASSVKV